LSINKSVCCNNFCFIYYPRHLFSFLFVVYYFNEDNAVKFDLQNGKIETICFCRDKHLAEETIYAIYETEINADNKKQAEKIALDTCVYDYKNNDLSNSAGDFTIEEIEEIK